MFKKEYKARVVVTEELNGSVLFEVHGLAHNVLGMLIAATASAINESRHEGVSDETLAQSAKEDILRYLSFYRGAK